MKEFKELPENLILGYLKKELSKDEMTSLLNWLKSDSENKRQFDEYCEIWVTAQMANGVSEFNARKGFLRFKEKISHEKELEMRHNRKNLFITISRYAALLILAFSAGGFLFYQLGKKSSTEDDIRISELVVPLGSKAQFFLSDGTAITLNAGSRLKYDNSFGKKDRVVQLEGEGYFKVAKDSERPFTVKTSHINVEALGTEFNVKAYSEDCTIETTLVEGSVKVEDISKDEVEELMVLKPNQKLIYSKRDGQPNEKQDEPGIKTEEKPIPQVEKINISKDKITTKDVDIEPVISWKESRWIIDQKGLSQLAIDLERKYDVKIIFESEQLKSYRFTGILLEEPIEQVLEVMSISAPIDFKLEGKVVTLYENKSFRRLNKKLYNQ